MAECKICGKISNSIGRLAIKHFVKHNISSQEYYNKYIKSGDDGICLICNSRTNYINCNKGYHVYCGRGCALIHRTLKTTAKRFCICCGKQRKKGGKFCSRDCYLLYMRESIKQDLPKCKRCNNSIKRKGNIYCSKECVGKTKRTTDNFNDITKRCGNPCLICRKICSAVINKYCSRECGGIALRKPKNNCPICDKLCSKSTEKFCSDECVKKWKIKNGLTKPVKNKLSKIKIKNKKASDRMKKNNPMYNPLIVAKVSKTLKEKYKKGEIKKRFGPKNPAWKGSRSFSDACRIRLYMKWILPIMERDGFKCTICELTGHLQVHHKRKMINIVNLVLKKENIQFIEELKGTNKYENLIDKVVMEHNLNDGITVCKWCHTKIDERYRRYRNDKKP